MHHGNVSGGEAGFTVFKIIIPRPHEGFVEAEFEKRFLGGIEAIVPVPESVHVECAEVLEIVEEEIAGFAKDFVNPTHAHKE